MITIIALSSLMILFLYAAITSQAGLKRIQLHKIWEGRIRPAWTSHADRKIKAAKKKMIIIGCITCGDDFLVDQRDPFTICPGCLRNMEIPFSEEVKTYVN